MKVQLRSEKLQVLRGEDEGQVVQTSLSCLRSGIEGLYEDFTRAEKEEEEARKVGERVGRGGGNVVMIFYSWW